MRYRREIDGLRAVAVLPVVLFHAGLAAFAGGFVGVDVFFVISGYLIATVILTEQRRGTFTLVRFYERRARRILPALTVVIVVTAILAWWWLLPNDLIDLGKSMLAVSVFGSNVLYWKQSGYFDAAESKPLLHTWSLAVEEQFYLVFPLLLLLLARARPRTRTAVLAGAALASLALAQWGAVHRPAGTFYLLPTRAWELLIGALLAVHLLPDEESGEISTPRGAVPRERDALAEGMSVLGIALIVGSAALYDRSTPFPGLYALAPTVGTALVIRFARAETYVGRVLGSRPLVGIGLVSYSVYLWHQPLFALARLHAVRPLSDARYLQLSLLAVILGVLTWRFVERPFRDPQRVSRRGILTFAGGSTLLLAALGAWGVRAQGFPGRFSIDPEVAATLTREELPCFSGPLSARVEDSSCPLGPPEGAPTFVVIGDSHARALAVAFREAAAQRGVRGILATRGACTPFVGIHALRDDQAVASCHALNAAVLDYVRAHRIRTVILVARWSLYTDGGYDGKNLSLIGLSPDADRSKASSRAAFEQGLAQTVAAYSAIGAHLIVVDGLPQQQVGVAELYYKLAGDSSAAAAEAIRAVSVTVTAHRRLQQWPDARFARFDSRADGLQLVRLDSVYCDEERCPIGDARRSWYMDAEHVSTVGARRAVPAIMALLPTPSASPAR